ncbi:hypothetical protein BH09BAC3_BH09BAC3_17390 [soil metagenome]
MKMTIRGGWILLLVLAGGCVQKKEPVEKFFDFKELLDEQTDLLSQHGRSLDKTSYVMNQNSDTTFVPSNYVWKTELELFQQLEEFNKPIYKSEYRIEDAIKDTRSNLKIRQYISERAPIRSMKFYYHEDFAHLKKIEATIHQNNLLYTNGLVLVMEFEDEDGKPLLSRYTMNGFQKMMLRDSVHYSLEGQVDQ